MGLRRNAAIVILLALCAGAYLATGTFAYEEDDEEGKAAMPAVYTTPLLMLNNRLFTYAEINDADRRLFFIDNGWSDTTLQSDIVDFEPFSDKNSVTVSMMDKKRVTEHYGRINTLEFGGLTLNKPVVRFSEQMEELSRGLGRRVFGVLGQTTMRGYLTTFDFRSKKVFFYRHTPEAVAEMQNVAGNVTLPFREHPFSAASEQIFSVKLAINGVEVDAVVDLGYNGGVLTTFSPSELGVSTRHLGSSFPVAICGYTGKGSRTHAVEVEAGEHKLSNVHTIFFDSSSAPRFVLVGVDFLHHFRTTFDYVNQKMYLVPNK